MSKQQHHSGRGVLAVIVFVFVLLAIATGPIGLIVLVLAGIPIAVLVAFDLMAHGGSK